MTKAHPVLPPESFRQQMYKPESDQPASWRERFRSFGKDLVVLRHLAFSRTRGADHQARLEAFYSGQADQYDRFRERLLHGRRELIEQVAWPEDGVWLDLGCGTASNLELLGPRRDRLSEAHFLDLAPSLLEKAQQRIESLRTAGPSEHQADAVDGATTDASRGRSVDMRTHLRDVTQLDWDSESVDVVTFSYSLTMIPDWFAAISEAKRVLKPGGLIAVVDFFVARKHPTVNDMHQSSLSRAFWTNWFGWDNVFLSSDHLPLLRREFSCVSSTQARSKVPYLPFIRAPYYHFIGKKN